MDESVIRIAQWEIAPEETDTRIVYNNIMQEPGCDCGPCRNFEKLGSDAFPPEMHEIFRQLGIDYTKPAEIYYTHRLDSGLHSYGGWYHFIGSIVAGEDCRSPNGRLVAIETVQITDAARIGFSNSTALVHDAFEEYPVVQLEFTLELPWILNEEEPD
jgi:hypothetical protein